MEWIIDGKPHVQANITDISKLQMLPGAPHVKFACLCGHGYWTSKNIALRHDGKWDGSRNIFHHGRTPECSCSADKLVCVVEKV